MNAEVLIKFKGDTTDADKATKNLDGIIGNLAKSFTLASLAADAITKSISIMSQHMDDAISRVDTMNNFPRVMSNLGISAEDSAEVIADLSEKLQGLPTTLDAAASSVQRFASKNGNVKDSEKIFLAVNNAILAGGASANIQSQALEQISQAYAKGKPDMMEWRSLMTAMPAQLKQVATAMGYTDVAMLGEAVRAENGEQVFSKMIDTMVRMNSEGVAGFKSFDEQARNATGGIGTSITNMRTAITRGVADMITKIDETLKPFGGLSGVIQKIGKIGEKVFKKIGDVLVWLIKKFIDLGKWINKNKDWLIPLTIAVGTFIATFITIKKIIAIITAVKTAFMALSAVMMANPITLIVAAIAGLVAAFIYLWNNCEAFRQFWIGLWDGLCSLVQGAIDFIVGLFSAVIDFIANNWQGILLFIVNPFAGAFKLVYDNCEGFRNFIDNLVQNIIDFFAKLPGNLLNIGKNMITALWNGAKGVKDWAVDKVKGIGKAILNGLKSIFEGAKDIGVNLVKGLWNGIKSVKDWIISKIGGFTDSVVNAIKGFFGIHSPSKLMADQIGQYLPKGIAVGIDANTDSVYKSMRNMENELSSSFGLSPNLSNSSAFRYNASAPITNVYVNSTTDPLGQTVSRIKTFSGGAKNDYNYGMGV